MSSVKKRYDGKGSEFGKVHRLLPVFCGMFDIDKMKATATMDLELKKQDIAFMEYRTNWDKCTVTFKALIEIKYKASSSVWDALRCKIGTATFAQFDMCRQLNCRYLFVIATNGKQPFKFYEKESNGHIINLGILDYTEENKKQKINEYWKIINML